MPDLPFRLRRGGKNPWTLYEVEGGGGEVFAGSVRRTDQAAAIVAGVNGYADIREVLAAAGLGDMDPVAAVRALCANNRNRAPKETA